MPNTLTRAELQTARLATVRAIDSLRPNETELRAEFERLYDRIREIQAADRLDPAGFPRAEVPERDLIEGKG